MKNHVKYKVIALTFFCWFAVRAKKPRLQVSDDFIAFVQKHGVWNKNKPLVLHLGCGRRHFDGCVNIDFPPSEHTVQTVSGADVFGDITQLKLSENTVDGIRSHHVFEHFDRSVAIALLCKWHEWLKVGGTLFIETPDFKRSAEVMFDSSKSYLYKQQTLRHIFGSHEAKWAIHCDGWYQEKFERVLSHLGFTDIIIKLTGSNSRTPCIIVQAKKTKNIDSKVLYSRALDILKESLIDDRGGKLFDTWRNLFNQAINSMMLS